MVTNEMTARRSSERTLIYFASGLIKAKRVFSCSCAPGLELVMVEGQNDLAMDSESAVLVMMQTGLLGGTGAGDGDSDLGLPRHNHSRGFS